MAGNEPDFSKLPVRLTQPSGRKGSMIVEIDATTVNVTATGLSGRDHWSEPITSFTGVFRRDTMKTRSEVAILVFVYHVELLHPDPRKNVSLFQTTDFEEAQKTWIEAARLLNLPAIEDTPAGYITREYDELDKPLCDVLAAQTIELNPDSPAEPWPENLVRRDGKTLSVTYREKLPFQLSIGLMFIFAGILIQKIGGSMSMIFSAVSIIAGIVITGGAFVFDRYFVTPTHISSITRTPVGNFAAKSIPLNDLRNIMWVTSVRSQEGRLRFISDHTEIQMKFVKRASLAKRLGRFVMATMVGRMPER